jgi:hypothetical protein
MKKQLLSALFFVLIFLCHIQPVFAFKPLLSNSKDGSTAYTEGCISEGNCQLNDFIVLAVRVSEIILALTGSLALLALVYGGVLFLISAGNTEQISKAKGTILYAFIGILVVFFSFTIIAFIYKSLGLQFAPHLIFK